MLIPPPNNTNLKPFKSYGWVSRDVLLWSLMYRPLGAGLLLRACNLFLSECASVHRRFVYLNKALWECFRSGFTTRLYAFVYRSSMRACEAQPRCHCDVSEGPKCLPRPNAPVSLCHSDVVARVCAIWAPRPGEGALVCSWHRLHHGACCSGAGGGG